MSRRMKGDESAAFRAVVWVVPYEGEAWVSGHYGPYATESAAKGRLTVKVEEGKSSASYRARGWWDDDAAHKPEDAVTGHIERSSVEWKRVED
jgi:hypothetical protein